MNGARDRVHTIFSLQGNLPVTVSTPHCAWTFSESRPLASYTSLSRQYQGSCGTQHVSKENTTGHQWEMFNSDGFNSVRCLGRTFPTVYYFAVLYPVQF